MVTTAERSALLMASPPPVRNGIIISYIISYHVDGSTGVVTINSTTNNMFLNHAVMPLMPFTNYVFTVRACTIAGCGPASENVTALTLEDGELASIMHTYTYIHMCIKTCTHMHAHTHMHAYTYMNAYNNKLLTIELVKLIL